MFRGLTLIPLDVRIPFMRVRRYFFVFSAVIILGSVALFTIKGLNYGIDFKGGILIEARLNTSADLGALRGRLGSLDLGEVTLQEFGGPADVLIRIERQKGDEKAQQQAVEKVKTTLGTGIEYRRIEFVGPQVGKELFREGIIAIVLALAGIVVYIAFRFEWKFAICAIVAELHDVLTTVGLFALFDLDFNLSTVAALLTIAGYSINDTVVVLDRVRENLRKYKTMPLIELFDLSINETLSRTVVTSGTTLLAVLALLIFGGPVIRDLNIALLWGIAIGTYSSVCVAVPLLLYLKIERRATVSEDKGAEGKAAAHRTP
jgi:preprotein translocase subunit SecF